MTWIQRTSQKTIDQLLSHWTFESTASRVAALTTIMTVVARAEGWDRGPCPYFVISAPCTCFADTVTALAGGTWVRSGVKKTSVMDVAGCACPVLCVENVPEDWTAPDWWMPLCTGDEAPRLSVLMCVSNGWRPSEDFARRTVRFGINADDCTGPLGFVRANKRSVRKEVRELLEACGGNPLFLLGRFGSFGRSAQ